MFLSDIQTSKIFNINILPNSSVDFSIHLDFLVQDVGFVELEEGEEEVEAGDGDQTNSGVANQQRKHLVILRENVDPALNNVIARKDVVDQTDGGDDDQDSIGDESDEIERVVGREDAEDEEDSHDETDGGDHDLGKEHIEILGAVDEEADDALDNDEDGDLPR